MKSCLRFGTLFFLLFSNNCYSQIPTDGLIAYYPFNGNANDESGNNHHATVYNATLTTDRFGQSNKAYYFNGNDAYIDLGDWQNGGPLSICIWVKYSAFNNYARVFHLGTGIGGTWYYETISILNLDYDPHAYAVVYKGTSGDGKAVSSNNFFSAGNWVFTVFTASGTSMKLYKNGVLDASTTDGYEPNTITRTDQYLGRQNMSWDQWFYGYMDDLRIYSRELTAAEVLNLYNEPLPVKLKSFNYEIAGQSVKLVWQTATEINNYGFEIHRKSENSNWIKIGFTNGYGNSNSIKNYSFIDRPTGGKNFVYRLKQIDFDGRFEYSNDLMFSLDIPDKFYIYQNHPNPFNPITKIKYEIPAESKIKLSVFDLLGREVSVLVNEILSAGIYETTFDASALCSGVYFYTLGSGKNFVTKRMILMK